MAPLWSNTLVNSPLTKLCVHVTFCVESPRRPLIRGRGQVEAWSSEHTYQLRSSVLLAWALRTSHSAKTRLREEHRVRSEPLACPAQLEVEAGVCSSGFGTKIDSDGADCDL